MENLLKKIEELREKLLNLWELLDIERAKVRLAELKDKMNAPDFGMTANGQLRFPRCGK